MAQLQLSDLRKSFGPVQVIKGLNLDVADGEFVVFVGPSGCGKSTTLRMIAGLEDATSGTIRLDGRDVTRTRPADRSIAMVFQSYALFPHMSVIENVAYGPSVKGLPKAQAHSMARDKLAVVGMKGYEERLPSELSGGQQQRVAVARALVLEPQVLLFDEPLSNLDAKLRRRMREEIRDLQRKLNLTVAYVTHDQEEALAVSDKIIVMSNAVIAQEGAPRALYEEPANVFVADFIGDANLIDVEILAIHGDRADVAVGPIRLSLPARGLPPGKAKLAVRPESLLIVDEAGSDRLPGTISKCAYLGNHLDLDITTPAGTFYVTSYGSREIMPEGQAVSLAFADFGVTLVPAG